MTAPVSRSPVHPVQVAMFTALSEDAELLELATGGVWDQVPEDIAKPYVRLGEHLSVPDNDHSGFGREVTVTLHVWTRERGNASGQAIANRIIELLDHQPAALVIVGHRAVSIRCEFDQALIDPDPQIRHHVIRFRIVTAQEEGS